MKGGAAASTSGHAAEGRAETVKLLWETVLLSAGFDALSTRLDSLDQRAGNSDSLLVVLFFFHAFPL